MSQLRRFDMQALHRSLDESRRARGLSWSALAAEINKPFEGTSSIPISVGTLRNMGKKSSVTSGVVLQVLRWLRRTPESFLSGGASAPIASANLPEPGPLRLLRFDTRAMYAALDAERATRGMSWKEIAAQLPGFTESMLRNLANGPLIGFPRAILIPQWLVRPAAEFVRIDRG
jgi:hypothetical protein